MKERFRHKSESNTEIRQKEEGFHQVAPLTPDIERRGRNNKDGQSPPDNPHPRSPSHNHHTTHWRGLQGYRGYPRTPEAVTQGGALPREPPALTQRIGCALVI